MPSEATKTGSIPRVLHSTLLIRAGFVHGFTTRDGTLPDLPLEEANVYLVSQVHGSDVFVASGVPAEQRAVRADAIVLGNGLAGAIRVADCVPVLVGDTKTGRAATIHAGWRGVASGVVPATIATMRSPPRALVVAIGPCIESCCFEVGNEVAEQLAFAVPAPGVVVREAGGKSWVDLVVAVRAQLEACGITRQSIERVGACTKCDPARYHSYRRDGAASGRLLGVIQARA